METANFLNHHPFSRSLPRSRSEDGDEDDGDEGDNDDEEEEEDDSVGNREGVWLRLAMIIIMFKTLANGGYGDVNDVDTGS